MLAAFSLAAGSVAVGQTVRMRDSRERADRAEVQVVELEQRIADLEEQLAAGPGAAGGGLNDLLGGILGDGGLDGLGDLFGPDGLSGLEDLLGGGGVDGLLGEGGLGDLGSLFGGGDQTALAACIAPGTKDGAVMPDEIAAALELITDRVEADRQLTFDDTVAVEFLVGDALEARVESLTAGDYTPEDAALDQRVLVALGAISPDTDLRETLIGLYGDQVAGFYDPDTGELVVGTDGDADPATQMFLAHELVHALTDEQIGLPDLEDFEGNDDAGLASTALIEGDASLAMQRYAVTNLGLAEQLSLATGGDTSFDGVPAYLAAQLTFPYVEGLNWVCDRYVEGGWDAVDAAYANPPTTTLEIMDPQLQRGAVAADVEVATIPGDGWTLLEETTFGAAELLFLFQAPGDDPDLALAGARDAALGWRGGRLAVWDKGGATAVNLVLEAADESLCGHIHDWYSRAFTDDESQDLPPAAQIRTASFTGGAQEASLVCAGTSVILGIAPTGAEATTITGN